ncbi:hypothetical protein DYQ86_17265 [Acidobacteria bacterium AB60]|nr:hypothetical protein DYQ86_17265 [Acidobacteria bacterium AB60]
MTTLDIKFRYATQPSEAVLLALSGAREVYGIRRINFDREKQTVLVEYDATRLTGAVVANLLRRSGLDIVEELSLIPPPPTPAPAAPAA